MLKSHACVHRYSAFVYGVSRHFGYNHIHDLSRGNVQYTPTVSFRVGVSPPFESLCIVGGPPSSLISCRRNLLLLDPGMAEIEIIPPSGKSASYPHILYRASYACHAVQRFPYPQVSLQQLPLRNQEKRQSECRTAAEGRLIAALGLDCRETYYRSVHAWACS